MAKKDTPTKDSLGDKFVPAGPEHEESPVPVDVEHERNLKVTAMMDAEVRWGRERAEPDPEGVELRVEPVDVDHEHSLIQEAMVESRPALRGTTQDGLEGVPSHREGEVWESMASEDDDVGGGRRRVRVQSVEKGEVTAVNLVTGHVSHFRAENLVPPRWRRAHS